MIISVLNLPERKQKESNGQIRLFASHHPDIIAEALKLLQESSRKAA